MKMPWFVPILVGLVAVVIEQALRPMFNFVYFVYPFAHQYIITNWPYLLSEVSGSVITTLILYKIFLAKKSVRLSK